MIMKLKMRTAAKVFGKICFFKLLKIPFFQIRGLQSREGRGET